MKRISDSNVIFGLNGNVIQEIICIINKHLFKFYIQLSYNEKDSIAKIYLLNKDNDWTDITTYYLYNKYEMSISYSDAENCNDEIKEKVTNQFNKIIYDLKLLASELSLFIGN